MRNGYAIGDVSARTGVPVATLRMWEHRAGFPEPSRLPSGHRRYSEHDVELIRAVAAARAAGLPLLAAIERAEAPANQESVFASLAGSHPQLQPRVLTKAAMLALTRAIEDETLARGERPTLFGAFQRELFYRRSQRRWAALSQSATASFVFADFARVREHRGRPTELPLPSSAPLAREWAVVCRAPGYCACISGREVADGPRPGPAFEAVWSVEPDVCDSALRVCARLAAEAGRHVEMPVHLPPPHEAQLRLATSISSRALATLGNESARPRRRRSGR